jgi:hypothetical protein
MANTHYSKTAAHEVEDHSVHHESKDINISGVFAFAVGLFVVTAIIQVLVWLLFMYFGGREAAAQGAPMYPLAVAQGNRLPPEPRLQTHPREDLKDLRDGEDVILNSYGWVDKNNGVVHIPIGDAMKLTLERGLPARQAK